MGNPLVSAVALAFTILHCMLVVTKTSYSNYVLTLCTCWKTGPQSFIARVYLFQTLVTLLCSVLVVTNCLSGSFEISVGEESMYGLIFGGYFHSLVFNLFSSVTLSQIVALTFVRCLLCVRNCTAQAWYTWLDVPIFLKYLNVERACGVLLLICLATLCSLGIGFCLVIVVIDLIKPLRLKPSRKIIDFECNTRRIPYIGYGGNNKVKSTIFLCCQICLIQLCLDLKFQTLHIESAVLRT